MFSEIILSSVKPDRMSECEIHNDKNPYLGALVLWVLVVHTLNHGLGSQIGIFHFTDHCAVGRGNRRRAQWYGPRTSARGNGVDRVEPGVGGDDSCCGCALQIPPVRSHGF